MFDIINYLEYGTDSMNRGVRIMELNLSANDDVINDPEAIAMMQYSPSQLFNDSKKVSLDQNINKIVNNNL